MSKEFSVSEASYDELRNKLQEVREHIATATEVRNALESELVKRNAAIDEALGPKAAGLMTLEKRAKLDKGLHAARMAEAG